VSFIVPLQTEPLGPAQPSSMLARPLVALARELKIASFTGDGSPPPLGGDVPPPPGGVPVPPPGGVPSSLDDGVVNVASALVLFPLEVDSRQRVVVDGASG
jgi:hypothetical protein